MLHLGGVQVQTVAAPYALRFESPTEICLRVFRDLKPRTKPPEVELRFCPFANADSFIQLRDGRMVLRICDALEGAPTPILEALAYILVGKLYRMRISGVYQERYRRYLSRKDIRRSLHLLRQLRGRKFVSGPQGEHFNLEPIFEELNVKYFNGLMARPLLGWSRRPSRTILGHYDPSHNAIILSKTLDRPEVSRLAVDYVLFHEMLHLKHPVDHRPLRRCVHTAEFRGEERQFERLKEARDLLKRL